MPGLTKAECAKMAARSGSGEISAVARKRLRKQFNFLNTLLGGRVAGWVPDMNKIILSYITYGKHFFSALAEHPLLPIGAIDIYPDSLKFTTTYDIKGGAEHDLIRVARDATIDFDGNGGKLQFTLRGINKEHKKDEKGQGKDDEGDGCIDAMDAIALCGIAARVCSQFQSELGLPPILPPDQAIFCKNLLNHLLAWFLTKQSSRKQSERKQSEESFVVPIYVRLESITNITYDERQRPVYKGSTPTLTVRIEASQQSFARGGLYFIGCTARNRGPP